MSRTIHTFESFFASNFPHLCSRGTGKKSIINCIHIAIWKEWLLKCRPQLRLAIYVYMTTFVQWFAQARFHSHRIHLFFHILIWIIWWIKRKLFAFEIERGRKNRRWSSLLIVSEWMSEWVESVWTHVSAYRYIYIYIYMRRYWQSNK